LKGRWFREVVAVGREDLHVPLDQQEHSKLLGNKITGKAARVLDHDRADAVAFDTVQQRRKAGRTSIGSAPLTAGS
jgi:hypothetical protein